MTHATVELSTRKIIEQITKQKQKQRSRKGAYDFLFALINKCIDLKIYGIVGNLDIAVNYNQATIKCYCSGLNGYLKSTGRTEYVTVEKQGNHALIYLHKEKRLSIQDKIRMLQAGERFVVQPATKGLVQSFRNAIQITKRLSEHRYEPREYYTQYNPSKQTLVVCRLK